MTVPGNGPADQPEAAAVIVIDLRASATGPDAADPGSIDERTLEERQRRSHDDGAGHPSGWHIMNFERLLVIDDAAEFAQHEDDYRHLIEAPTFGRMLCLVIGAPAEPPYLDLPTAADAARVPVVWLGDPRGVGWRIGRANTTRLAFSDTDPDGTVTVTDLIQSLTSATVFDEIAASAGGLPDRTGVPALLTVARWPLADGDGAAKDHQPTDVKPTDSEAPSELEYAPASPHDQDDAGLRRSPRLAVYLLLALCCVVIAVAALVAVRLGRQHVGYIAADLGTAAVVLLVLLSIAGRRRARPAVTLTVPVLVPVSGPDQDPEPPEPEPAEPEPPLPATPPDQEILDHAQRMMSASVTDDEFRQLSSPQQLVMLNGDPELATLVRFAPVGAQSLIAQAVDGDSISWTLAGDQLGVIRLIPMKAGLVRRGRAG